MRVWFRGLGLTAGRGESISIRACKLEGLLEPPISSDTGTNKTVRTGVGTWHWPFSKTEAEAQTSWSRVWGSGFGVWGLGSGVWGLEIWGLGIAGLRFGVWGVGLHTLFSRKS